MTMNKKYILILLIISSILLLSGCWNYREIERLAIVSGLAVDKDENSGEYLLTTEIVDVKETMGKTTLTSKKIDSKGKTILDAIRNMIKAFYRQGLRIKITWHYQRMY
jgi:spore germination protein KC